MSRKLKLISAFLVLTTALAYIIHRARPWPPLPNSPVPLAELIEKSDLILHARVLKVEATPPIYTGTNRWLQKVSKRFRPDPRNFETAHLHVLQTIKGSAPDRVLADYPTAFTRCPPPETDWTTKSMIVFFYWQHGAYHPVAYSYGTRLLKHKEADQILRLTGEFVAMDKLTRRAARQRNRAEWFIKLMENPDTRWDGAASCLYAYSKQNQTLTNLPPDLFRRMEAVAFRDEPLGPGDDVLLPELAATHPRKVVERILNYFQTAAASPYDYPEKLPQPWRCYGAMQLLAKIADMPIEFIAGLNDAPFPNLSTPSARRDFIQTHLEEIQQRLNQKGLLPEPCVAAN